MSYSYLFYSGWDGIGALVFRGKMLQKVFWPIYGKKELLNKIVEIYPQITKSSEPNDFKLSLLLTNYFVGKKITFEEVEADFSEFSLFEKKVLEALLDVSYGEAISYKDLAKKAGYPMAFRAVGSVVSKNPLPVIVPCHRVIKSDGSLGGWSGPEGWKERLLEAEKPK